MAKVDAHLSGRDIGTDSGAACVNTPPVPLSVPLTAAAPLSCEPASKIPCQHVSTCENNKHKGSICKRVQFVNIDGLFHFFVKFLVEVHGFKGTEYMVSS